MDNMSNIEYYVTSIADLTKKSRLIYINYQPAFALYLSEIRQFDIRIGSCISSDHMSYIVDDYLAKRATRRAMFLLKDRDYTKKQLEDKLKSSYYPESSIKAAFDYISRYGYIDDKRYAENYVNFKSESKTRRQIECLLISKGVSESIVKEVCDNYYYEKDEDFELNKAIYELEKKYKDLSVISAMDYNNIQKVKGFLYRKGYSTDIINKALDVVEETY